MDTLPPASFPKRSSRRGRTRPTIAAERTSIALETFEPRLLLSASPLNPAEDTLPSVAILQDVATPDPAAPDLTPDPAIMTGSAAAGTTATLSGTAYSWNTHIQLTGVQVTASGGTTSSASTDATGTYAITGLPADTYALTATATDNQIGRVITGNSALSALRVAAGINPNPTVTTSTGTTQKPLSPYELIAADVNGDGRVTGADALAILRIAAGQSTAITPTFKFVAEGQSFYNAGTGSLTIDNRSVPTSFATTQTVAGDGSANFVAVLSGDVLGRYVPLDGSGVAVVNPPTLPSSYFATLGNTPGYVYGIAATDLMSVTAGLKNDTGVSATDLITSDATVTGQVNTTAAITSFKGALDTTASAAFTDLTDTLGAGGGYTLTAARLTALAGGTLADGPHTLHLVSTDANGNLAKIDLAFTLLTAAPSISTLGLSAASGSAADNSTAASSVVLTGMASANATVTVGGQSGLAQGDGRFQVGGVKLADGANALTATVTDLAGNTSQATVTITKTGTITSDVAITWNQLALDAIQATVIYPEDASRVLAIMSLAQYDTLAAIQGTPAFLVGRTVTGPISIDLALAQAADTVLTNLFPSLQGKFDAALAALSASLPDGPAKTSALALGASIGQAVYDIRASDGSNTFVDYTGSSQIGKWRPTGPNYLVAEDAQWGNVTPFVLTSSNAFRPGPPPALGSAEYAASLNEVQSLGSTTSTTRTADQTQQAQFWADGRGSTTPPGHWVQIAQQVALARGNSLAENVRLFAQLDTALADSAIAAWDAKYTYGGWRPADAIHNADQDGNAATTADPAWTSLLIAPAHPDYVSGHSTFSAAAAAVLANAFGDATSFATVSSTLPGVTRSFTSFSQAAAEAGRSRVYAGIHFEFSDAAGAAIGRQVGAAALARFSLSTDTQPPSVIVPPTPAAVNTNLTLAGQILDNISGVAAAGYSLDGGAAAAITLDAQGRFAITTALALDGSADGPHTLSIVATDRAGNATPAFTRRFTLDTVAPALTITSLADNDVLTPASRLVGVADPTGSTLMSLTLSVDGGRAQPVSFGASGAFDQALPTGNLDIGAHTLLLTAKDAAGNVGTLTRTVTVAAVATFSITGTSIADGAVDVGTTQRPQVMFSRAVNAATLTPASFYATGADGTVLSTTIVPATDGSFAWLFFNSPMPGGAHVTVHVAGSLIRGALDGAFLDADNNGTPGGDLSFSYSTVSLTPVTGTKLIGRVVDPGPDLVPGTFDDIRRGPDGIIHTADDVFLLPIANAKVYILGREDQVVYTDAQGYFTLDNIPAGTVKVAVDGRTSTNPPAGVFFPEMVMSADIVAGVTNTLMGTVGTAAERAANLTRTEVYLPRVQSSVLQTVADNGVPTTITTSAAASPSLTVEQRASLTLTVPAGSAVGLDGKVLSNVQVGIATVPPELVKDMLPPGVLQHTFDITIQAPGVATFTQPVQITFPNVFNASPGTKLNVLSFDHTTGMLVINGTATVSADGLTVVSDPGGGIKAPGWHGLTPPGAPNDPPCPPGTPHTIDVPPVPVTSGVADHFYSDDDGKFTLSLGNAAKLIDPNSDPCSPTNIKATPLVVTVTVDGNAATFLSGLTSNTYTLSPGQQQNIDVTMKKLLTPANLAAATGDKLYGTKIHIEGHKDGDATVLLSKDVYVYRFFDSSDDKHNDDTINFVKTQSDPTTGATQKEPLDISNTPSGTTVTVVTASQFKYDGANATFSPTDAITAGTSKVDTDKLQITTPSGGNVGAINFSGIAIGKQNILVPLADFQKQVALLVDQATPTAKESTFLSLFPAAPMPGAKRSTAPGFAVEVKKLYDAAIANVYTSFAALSQSAQDAVQIFNTAANNAIGGIGVVFDVPTVTKPGLPDLGNFPATALTIAAASAVDIQKTKFLAEFNPAPTNQSKLEQEFRLAGLINNTYTDKSANYNGLFINLDKESEVLANKGLTAATAEAAYERLLANNILHEVGHDLGAIHLRGGVGNNYVNDLDAMGNPILTASPSNDIMGYAGSDTASLHTFQQRMRAVIDYALGLPVAAADFDTTVQYYKTYMPLETYGFASLAAQHDGTDPVIAGPLLAVLDGPIDGGTAPNLLANADFGIVKADGPGNALVTRTIYLTNDGGSDLTITSVGLLNGAQGFSITGFSGPVTLEHLDPGGNAAASTLAITVKFDPTAIGSFTDALRITSNSLLGAEQTISLSGRSLAATASIAATVPNDNLGGQTIGITKTAAQFATLRNDGSQDLVITGAVSTSAEFMLTGLGAISAATPLTLHPGDTASFGLSFTPGSTGLTRGSIVFTSNDPAKPTFTVAVDGTGLAVNGTALHYGNAYVAIELLDNPAAPPLRMRSDDSGAWSFFLPANQRVHYVIFDPVSGLVAHGYATTPDSGVPARFTTPVFMASTAPDTNGNGLPDDVKFAIGTSLTKRDTNNDGIDDFTSVKQGLDPTAGVSLPSGITAAAALKGSANSLVVTAAASDPTKLTAYVATGSAGLAIVDVSSFKKPVVLAELDLPGVASGVAVDTSRGLAVVATGESGLVIVNVADGTRPAVVQTVALADPARRVVVRDGIAYVASGTALSLVDISTGEVRQTVSVGGATLTDLVFSNDSLFTLDSSGLVRAISVVGDVLTVRGSLTVSGAAGRLSAAGRTLFLGSGNGFTGGFQTVDASNPDALTLLSGIDANNIGGGPIALNGSGLGIAVGQPGRVNALDVVDVSAPADTGKFVSRTILPGAPQDVALANGIAFVADGTSGLQVVNYLGFDTKGVAPTLTIALDAVDADTAKPGIQVVEGQTIHITPTVGDDVQVRSVELIVNGAVVATDPAYPFDFSIAVPSIAKGGTSVTVQARATDTGGNVTTTAVTTLEVVRDTFPPTVSSVSVAEGASIFFVRSIQTVFNKPIDVTKLTLSGVSLVNIGPDGTAGTADDVKVTVSIDNRGGGQVLSVIPSGFLSPGQYQLRLDPAVVFDRAGNQLAAPVIRNFTIRPASDIRAAIGIPDVPAAPSANPRQLIGLPVPFDPATAVATFQVIDTSGVKTTRDVKVGRADAGKGIAYFTVPDDAFTGDLVVSSLMGTTKTTFADGTFYLQILPVVTDVQVTSVASDGSTVNVTVSGLGFVEGNGSEYRFGTVVVADPGTTTGPDVVTSYPNYVTNGTVNLTLPLSDAASGPVVVKTAGGVSAAFTTTLTGLVATAYSGTPTDAAKPSANPGQAVTLVGAGLGTTTDVLLRYTDSAGVGRVVSVSPVSASADGTRASLVLPNYLNGVVRLQVLGAALAPALQIVPLLTSYNYSGTTLTLTGGGFVEGASTYTLAGQAVVDTAIAAGPDVVSAYPTYVENGTVNITDPVHGFGPFQVKTAGGTSVALPGAEANPGLGLLRDVAIDAAGNAWVVDNGNPGALHKINLASGAETARITFTDAAYGSAYTGYGEGLSVATVGFTLGGTAVPAGSLLLFHAAPSPDRVIALDPTTGNLIASLTLAQNYDTTGGVYDPTSGHLFLLDRRANPTRIAEVNAQTGAQINTFDLPFNAGEAGLALNPNTGNLWYGSDQSTNVVEITRTGTLLRTLGVALQGVDQNEISGLAFDAAGLLVVSSTQGSLYKVDTSLDLVAQTLATLTGVTALATDGTPATAAASANVGQVIELTGTHFGAGTQVLFNTRDALGVTSTVAAAPVLVNAAGTRLQVVVPDQARTGDVRVVNAGARDLGFSSYNDAIYRQVTLSFTPGASTATIRFADEGLEGVSNESWGLDNVVVKQGASTVFQDNFEGGAKANWSNPLTDATLPGVFTQFSGRFNGAQTLNLTGLTAGQATTLTFDLYVIDSWDGANPSAGPDVFSVAADGALLMRDTFANYGTVGASTQSFGASAGIKLQVVPTLTATTQPGTDAVVTLTGSGFQEGASTITVGGRSFVDSTPNLPEFDVTGTRNDSYRTTTPLTVEGPVTVTTDGGSATVNGPNYGPQPPSLFTAIQASATAGAPADPAVPSANVGQTITLVGAGFTNSTLVQFTAVDDAGRTGVVTRTGSAGTGGKSLTIIVPELARTGSVSVLGSNAGFRLQVVPILRGVGGTVATGNQVLLDGTGLVGSELAVLVDGRAAGTFAVRSVADVNPNGTGTQQAQQLLSLTVPAGVTTGVITVATIGGSFTLRTGVVVASSTLTPGADVGDTLAAAQALALAAGGRITVNARTNDGTAAAGLDVDLYKITLASGDRLTLGYSGSNYGAVRVLDSTGAQLSVQQPAPSGTAPLVFSAPAAGTYYVGVSGYNNTTYIAATGGGGTASSYTGTYQLTLDRLGAGDAVISGITATAAFGTPARAAVASANVGQTITLLGTGLQTGETVQFSAIDISGNRSWSQVTAASVAADGKSLTVVVPVDATTGTVRLTRNLAGVLLQVVPRLTHIDAGISQGFNNAALSLTGSGFAEGVTTINFGTTTLTDTGRNDGLDVTYAYPAYQTNSVINLTTPSTVPTGPITVTTVGGTSEVGGPAFAGVVSTASGGTPASAAPSAIPGQSITVTGSGFDATTDLVFETINTDGVRGQQIVRPITFNAAGTSATVVVPLNAVTGRVRMVGDRNATEAPLQILPVVTNVQVTSVASDGSTVNVTLSGLGFVEGNGSEYRFGTVVVADPGSTTGPDVVTSYPNYVTNGTVNLTLPLSDAASGPIVVKTAGGVSAAFTTTLTGIVATAYSGTPTDAAQPSANPGQAVTLVGAGLGTTTDVLLRYTDSAGVGRVVSVSPVSASADGTRASLVLPNYLNGVVRLQVLGAALAPALQIVPLLTSYNYSGTTLTLTGRGFVEGASTYTLAGQAVVDTAIAAGPDVVNAYPTYVENATVNITDPVHGFGPFQVKTAGGTSVALPGAEANPGLGLLRDVAIDAAGAAWVVDNGNPGALHKINLANGAETARITFTDAAYGSAYTGYGEGLSVATVGFTLGGTAVPAGSLLLFHASPSPDRVIALDPTTGNLIASLTLAQNYDTTGGVYDPTSGHLFLLDRRANPTRVAEVNAQTGAQISTFDLPFNAGEAGLALNPNTGNLWYGSDQSTNVVEITRTGTLLRTLGVALQGVDQNEISGLAFDAAGRLVVSSTQGALYKVDTSLDPAAQTLATLTGVTALATDGTPATAAASANVGQVIELTGTHFGAGTEVLFNTRDALGVTSTVAAAPVLVNATGTRLQVVVPDQARTGDVRVVNTGARDLGFSSYNDAIYRQVTLSFTPGASTATIRFADEGLEGISNESWGLDNVVVKQGASTVFQDNFEGGAKANWSNPLTDATLPGVFTQFSGRFNGAQTLNLTGLTAGQATTLTFDLYVIDSWDGANPSAGPDVFSVAADGALLMRDTFANYGTVGASTQSFGASAGIKLQIVPTLTATTQPGTDAVVTLTGSGFQEGASTITVGGRSFVDSTPNLPEFDVTGTRNDSYRITTPLTVEGPVTVTTDGGSATVNGPNYGPQPPSLFTAIQASATAGAPADSAVPSANVGQTITLVGQNFSNTTRVQFAATDDNGVDGVLTRTGTASADGTKLTIAVPELARTGSVSVLGSNAGFRLQVVPTLRGVGGIVAAGNPVLLDGSGLVSTDLRVTVDGIGAGGLSLRTIAALNQGGPSVFQAGQQILGVTIPGGISAGAITITTAGGSFTLRTGLAAGATPLTPAADVSDTLAGAQVLALDAGSKLLISAKTNDGAAAAGLDVDLYRVVLNAGDQLTAALTGSTYSNLRLLDGTGAVLLNQQFNPNGTAPVIYAATASGTYFVGISGYGNASYDPTKAGSGTVSSYTGTYQLSIERLGAGDSHLSGIPTVAASGTPAASGVGSANVGQTVTFTGAGLQTGETVQFSAIDSSGNRYWSQTGTTVAPDGTSLTAVVPTDATTGTVRLTRDTGGVLLQVVPKLTHIDAPINQGFNNASLSLTGTGFAEGATSVRFGSTVLTDTSRSDGLDITFAGNSPNALISLTTAAILPTGPVTVTTLGGTSAVAGPVFTAVSGTANSGTPAAGTPSAIPGQTITVTGSGFDATTDLVFEVIDPAGARSQQIVRPATVNPAGTSATVLVPLNAVTGRLRMVGDQNATEAPLQIVPVVTGIVVNSVAGDGSSAVVTLTGNGFVEGGMDYVFGSTVVPDLSLIVGPDVQTAYPGYVPNGTAVLTVPISTGAFGAITVRSAGGTSAALTSSIASITAVAATGTPADAGQASANPGQTVTLVGTKLLTTSDILLRYTNSTGGPAMVLLHPATATADGTGATLVIPTYANGAVRLQMLGSSSQPLLQIVPVLTSYDVSGSTLTLKGAGFVEAGSTYGLQGAPLVDTGASTGPDVVSAYPDYVENGTVNITEPVHGIGPLTVTTAGGVSAPLTLNEFDPGYGLVRDIAVDTTSGATYVFDDKNPAVIHKIDLATGLELSRVSLTDAGYGSAYPGYGEGLQVAPAAFTLGATVVPKGSLLVFNAAPNPDRVIAVNPSTGNVIASLTLAANYDMTCGVFDPVSGHLFVLDRRTSPTRVAEVNAQTGVEIKGFNLPFNAGEAGLALNPVTNNLWYGSDQSKSVVEITRAGVVVRTVDLSSQGVNQNEISGLAFDGGGALLVGSTQGVVYRVSV